MLPWTLPFALERTQRASSPWRTVTPWVGGVHSSKSPSSPHVNSAVSGALTLVLPKNALEGYPDLLVSRCTANLINHER